jgi:hypothetical protein
MTSYLTSSEDEIVFNRPMSPGMKSVFIIMSSNKDGLLKVCFSWRGCQWCLLGAEGNQNNIGILAREEEKFTFLNGGWRWLRLQIATAAYNKRSSIPPHVSIPSCPKTRPSYFLLPLLSHLAMRHCLHVLKSCLCVTRLRHCHSAWCSLNRPQLKLSCVFAPCTIPHWMVNERNRCPLTISLVQHLEDMLYRRVWLTSWGKMTKEERKKWRETFSETIHLVNNATS